MDRRDAAAVGPQYKQTIKRKSGALGSVLGKARPVPARLSHYSPTVFSRVVLLLQEEGVGMAGAWNSQPSGLNCMYSEARTQPQLHLCTQA